MSGYLSLKETGGDVRVVMSASVSVTNSAREAQVVRGMSPKITDLYPLIGRVCFTLPFLFGGVFYPDIPHGCPHWELHLIQAVRLAVLVLSVCVLAGLRARRAAAVITVILIVGSLIDPPSRAVDDFMAGQPQHSLLLQYASLVGGAMVIGYFGSGPYSLDRQLSRWLRAFFHVRYTDIIDRR